MLTESVIRIGRPLRDSDLPYAERIRWLTDVDSENCKNFFQHVFLIEIDQEGTAFHLLELGDHKEKGFEVNHFRNAGFPILYPNGGNPLEPQGLYPIPCYLMYDPHIKSMSDPAHFATRILLPRLNRTISYYHLNEAKKERLAQQIAHALYENQRIKEERQLGILLIYDHSLADTYQCAEPSVHSEELQELTSSSLYEGQRLHLNMKQALANIVTARYEEAKSLGTRQQSVSTFTNRIEPEVASIYNKSWLWLSPTWEMPRSVYWDKGDWTKGIKIDKSSYEAFLYGAQFLKQITVPISSVVLKEMFAPVTNVEAKRNTSLSSFENIYGFPMLLPILEGDSQALYSKLKRIIDKSPENQRTNDLHLEVLTGLRKVIPASSDLYRLSIVYYSGDLSRGNMHIRTVIEDVVPSVAQQIEAIMKQVARKDESFILSQLDLNGKEIYRLKTLPALLANAYGPGYIWSTLQAVLHRQPLRLEKLFRVTAEKLKELANKEDYYMMRYELAFHYGFLAFYEKYMHEVVQEQVEVNGMSRWIELMHAYQEGAVTVEDVQSSEALGFISGLLLKQFSNSYYRKTGKDFVKQRVMRFGSRLTPEMIWKNGVMRCEELAGQWSLKLAENFRPALAAVMLGILDAGEASWSVQERDKFLTAFWSGYLLYKKQGEAEVHEGQ